MCGIVYACRAVVNTDWVVRLSEFFTCFAIVGFDVMIDIPAEWGGRPGSDRATPVGILYTTFATADPIKWLISQQRAAAGDFRSHAPLSEFLTFVSP
jgi:hypothetical protein